MATRICDLPRPEFPSDQLRAWLLDDELAVWDALHCQDIEVRITCGVRLKEYQGKRRRGRQERPRTAEQERRFDAASGMLSDRQTGYFNVRTFLARLAHERIASATPELVEAS